MRVVAFRVSKARLGALGGNCALGRSRRLLEERMRLPRSADGDWVYPEWPTGFRNENPGCGGMHAAAHRHRCGDGAVEFAVENPEVALSGKGHPAPGISKTVKDNKGL